MEFITHCSKIEGKQIRASLRTANFVEAKRTLGNEAEKTLRRKNDIADRLIRDFPKGKNYPINKITPSDLLSWLAKYEFGPASRQLYVMFLKALFSMAVEDKILPSSSAEKIKAQSKNGCTNSLILLPDIAGENLIHSSMNQCAC